MADRIFGGYISFDEDNKLLQKRSSETVADEASITLPTAVSGMLKVWTEAEYSEFFIKADGSVEYIRLSDNAIDSDTDGNLCVYDGGSNAAVIKNRLG